MPPDNAARSLYRCVGSIHLNLLSPVGEALSLPLRRSRLGSLSEGAAEQSEAEGVYCVGFCVPKFFVSVGEALSLPLRRSRLGSPERGAERSEAEGVYCVEWYKLIILHRPS